MKSEIFSITMEMPENICAQGATGLSKILCSTGCDDASIKDVGSSRFSFRFDRRSSSQAHAIYTALKDIHAAVPGAILIAIALVFEFD